MGQWGESAKAMKQVSLQVLPIRSIYEFEAGGVWMALTFTSPLLPHDLDVMSRPATYLTWDVRSVDNQTHQVSLYFDCTSEWVVNTSNERVVWARHKVGDLTVLSFGSQRQSMLEKSGDDLRHRLGIPLPRHNLCRGRVLLRSLVPCGEREFHHDRSAPRYRRPAHAAPGP